MDFECECICGAKYGKFMRYEAHIEHCHAYRSTYENKYSKAQQLAELASYGATRAAAGAMGTGKILHGCATCGEGFETPVAMGIHMLTECEGGPKMSREELLGETAPTDDEINATLASIADAAKETS